MSTRSDPSVVLADWLDGQVTARRPPYLDELLERTARTPQRPAWTFARRWLRVDAALPAFAQGRLVPLLLLLALLAALAVAVVTVVGAHRVAPPTGLARSGVIAWDSSGHIFVADADGSRKRQITFGPGIDSSPAFSSDGTRLAFWRKTADGQYDLVVANPAGAIERLIGLGQRVPNVTYGQPQPAWSPDGGRLAFTISVGGVDGIWVVDADGRGLHEASPPSLPAADPAWSPDGRRIAYHGGAGYGPSNGLYVMNADGTGARMISHVAGTGFAFEGSAWQPGGDLIAFPALRDGGHDIFVVRSDGSAERDISNDAADELWPSWSPDGRRIAFDRATAGQNANQVVITDPDGSHVVVLPGQPVDGGPPAWSPDAKAIVGFLFDPAVKGDTATMILDPAGHRQPVVLSGGPNVGFSSWQRLPP